MAITIWLDKISEVWGGIEAGNKGTKLRSYFTFKKAEFPESLSVFPCVLSYTTKLGKLQYSAGGPNILVWEGISEFHLYPNVNKGNYPDMMTWYEKIIRATAASLELGGIVEHFILSGTDPIVPGVLRYGGDEPHLGLLVKWQVKENLSITVSV